ncbi:MAG: hypothetical protein WC184_12870, partial [Acidimicrobiia bacterium]
VRRGLTLVEIILGLVVGALLVFAAFVSFQQVFTKTREHAELAALKSVAREAQALLAISGADRWDTQAGLDAVMGALEDWPPTQAARSVGVVADNSGVVVTEGDVWPEMSELTFTRSANTLLMVVALDAGACVVTAPPHTGTIQGGCVSNLDTVGENSPSAAVTNQQIPGINNISTQPEQSNSTTTTTEPEPDPGFWAQTSAGGGHTCGLTTGGDTYCWGNSSSGQLGNGNITHQNTPVKVSGNHSFVSLVAGYIHSCALTTDGDAYCWGSGTSGQLGNGNTVDRVTPSKVSGDNSFVSIAAGDTHSCGITTDGDAYCWGYNSNGQLGNGNTINQNTPTKVSGNHSFVEITAGDNHTCGVTSDGDLYCWGYNSVGQLGAGYGSIVNQTTPIKVLGNHRFVSFAAGQYHSCGITTDGDAYCWGYNNRGQLGIGNTINQNTPTKVSGNHSFVAVTADAEHSCGLTTDGDAYCWGYGGQGQLGNGGIYTQHATPAKVLGDLSFISITAGNNHTCGVTADGDAYCWGYNSNGQLGNGNTTYQTTPVLVVEP